MSTLLNEPISLYLIDLEYKAAGNEAPYLFHPTDDTSRCVYDAVESKMATQCDRPG